MLVDGTTIQELKKSEEKKEEGNATSGSEENVRQLSSLTFREEEKIPYDKGDYSHKNVPPLPSFLPVIATRLTTCCHRIYQ